MQNMKTLQEHMNEGLKKEDRFTRKDLDQMKKDWETILYFKDSLLKDLFKDIPQETLDKLTKDISNTRWEDIKVEAEKYNKTH